jgi:hypothetical protein
VMTSVTSHGKTLNMKFKDAVQIGNPRHCSFV